MHPQLANFNSESRTGNLIEVGTRNSPPRVTLSLCHELLCIVCVTVQCIPLALLHLLIHPLFQIKCCFRAFFFFSIIQINCRFHIPLNPKLVNIIPFYSHSIKNVGSKNSYTLMWISQIYNPDSADTFKH